MTYVLSPEAELDLLDVYLYSADEWGAAQAASYLDGLYEAFALSARYPKKGRLRADLQKDIRSVLYKSHVIFYLQIENDIAIVRVLHQSRDIDNEFSQ